MNLSRLFVLRPVGTALLMVAILLVGILAYGFLPMSALPEVDYPTISVKTLYPGASPEVMASAVTGPLERQFGQMPGLDLMSSQSSAGASMITLQFSLDIDIDIAEQEVQAAINAADSLLPSDLPAPPIYAKVNPADAPVLSIALTSPTLPLTQVEDLADTRLAMKLSQIAGVGLVSVAGGQRPAVRIQANPRVLASLGISIDDLRTILSNANVNTAKGSFDGALRASSINANDQISKPEDYASLVIAYKNGRPVLLRDVATVVQGAENTKIAAWVDREPAVVLNIQRQPGANVIKVVQGVRNLLPALQASLPAGVEMRIVSDRTETIRASVHDVQFELALAVALVVAVIFLFLRSWRATIIPSLSVPLSLVGALAVMYLLGFGLDNLSLMALTIASGFVVDDAIVMIENITRYVEAGETPLAATLKGAREIGFTILSLTVSLIAVLIPLLFMGDVVGRLFHEFAMTLAVTIVISAVVALTLVPMMCARLLRPGRLPVPGERGMGGTGKAAHGFGRIIHQYGRLLDVVLDHPHLTLASFLATFALTIGLYVWIPKGFFPVQDTGAIEAIVEGPQNTSFAAMTKRQQEVVDRLLADPDVASIESFVGIDGTNVTLNNGRLQINLKSRDTRTHDISAVMKNLATRAEGITGTKLYLQPVQDLTIDSTMSRAQYQLVLENPDTTLLADYTARMVAALEKFPALTNVSSDLADAGSTVNLVIDRATAGRFGITPATVDNALYDSFGQRIVSTIYTQSNQYRVILEAQQDLQQNLKALDAIYLPSSTASTGQVPLSAIVHAEEKPGPLKISHLGQFPAATISFDLAAGESLDAAVTAVDQARAKVALPASFVSDFQGAAAAFRSSLSNELFLLIAAIATMYIVLGVLYESVVHPLTILSTLPSAGVGALLALWISGHSLDIIAIIGIVLLIGIVKKNAIMMVDFALEAEREQGLDPRAAIHQASLLRFRPILMTTMAALLSALPLMLGSGTGSELRSPLGIAIVGGLLVSQVLTLLTTPVIYMMFAQLATRLRHITIGGDTA